MLAFQGLLEIVERQWFPKLADRLSLGWVTSTGQNSTTIVNSKTGDIASATVGDGNQGQVVVGSGNTQVQFHTDVDGEIQSAADLLTAGRLRSADAAFQKINTRYGSSLTEHQRYRIIANQAIVCAKNSQHERAATLFTQASALTTERNVTDRLLAQAASFRGQHEKAIEIVQQVLGRDQSDRQAAALRISNDRSERPTEEIQSELVDEIRDSLEVLYACIVRESSIGRFESSERFARIAIRKYPDDREVQIELARAIICRFEQKYGQRSVPSTLSADEKKQLDEAISLATAVLRDQELELSESNRTDLYSMRGLARSLLGSRDDALADWDEAAACSSSIERHLIPYVVRLHEAGREDEAIARLKPAVENSGDLTLASLYAELLDKRNNTGDRATAAMALSKTLKNAVDASSADLTTAFVDLASVSISAESSDDSGFFDLLEQTRDRLSDIGWRTVLANAALAAGDETEADLQVFGFSATSAIAVAADSRAALWTDDLAVASAAAEFGVSHHVWTPAVADDCVTRGTVDESEALALRTDMLSYGAINLPLDPAVLLQAGERAQWDPRESPLQGICRWFANLDLVAGFVLQVLTASLSALHQRDLMWHQKEATCLAMFRATSQRPDGNALLKALRQEIPNLFRLEVIHQDRVQGLIKRAIN